MTHLCTLMYTYVHLCTLMYPPMCTNVHLCTHLCTSMYRRLDDRTESRVVIVHRVGLTATIQVFHIIFLIIDICIYFVIFIFDQPALTSRCLSLGSPSSTSRSLFRTRMTSSTSFRLRRLRYVQKQAHKARICDSYLQIWNCHSLTHSLTHWRG